MLFVLFSTEISPDYSRGSDPTMQSCQEKFRKYTVKRGELRHFFRVLFWRKLFYAWRNTYSEMHFKPGYNKSYVPECLRPISVSLEEAANRHIAAELLKHRF